MPGATTTNGNVDLMRANLFKAFDLYDKTLRNQTYMTLAGNSGGTSQLYERVATVSGLQLPQVRSEFAPAPTSQVTEVSVANYQPQKRLLEFRMSDEAFINDQYGVVKGYGIMLKGVFDVGREYAAAVWVNGALDTAQIALPNGEALSSATHALEAGTSSNTFSGTQQLLSIKALEDATANLLSQLAYKGYMSPRYGPYQLEVATINNHLANRLIGSDKLPQTFDNDPNSVAGMKNPNNLGTVRRVVVNPAFSNPDWWALRSMPENENPRFWLDRYPFKLTQLMYDGHTDSWHVTAKESYLPCQFDWRGTFYSTAA